MPEFLGDIAGMLEIFAIALGLVLLHRAARDAAAGLLRVAGFVLVLGGVAVGACTVYYYLSYRSQGTFKTAYMMAPGAMMPGMMGAGTTMMPGMSMPRGGVVPPDSTAPGQPGTKKP